MSKRIQNMIKTLLVTALIFSPVIHAVDQQSPTAVGMPGGWNNIAVTDPGVAKAADFAVQQLKQGKLLKVVSAQSQVVAGVNYSLVLEISPSDGAKNKYSVTVFVPLPVTGKGMQLTASKKL
jgi:hypothetical protein